MLPHVQLGPVRDREHAHVLAAMHAGVEQVPDFRPLGLRIPLAELVAEREDAFLGARLFLVAPSAADAGVEAEFLDRFQQRHRLRGIARIGLAPQHHAATLDRILDAAHDQSLAQLGGARVTEIDHLAEVVAGVDMHQRKRKTARAKGLFGQAQQHDRILAAREQQHRPFALGGDLAQDEDGFRFQPVQVAALNHGRHWVFPESWFSNSWPASVADGRDGDDPVARMQAAFLESEDSHHQRPARRSSPGRKARVQGSQPMDG